MRLVASTPCDQQHRRRSTRSIEGPKGVGKTETAQRRANTDYRLDGPAGQVATANPQVVLSGQPPVLIDEWQRVPAVWDAIRRAVDDGTPPGSFCSRARRVSTVPTAAPAAS